MRIRLLVAMKVRVPGEGSFMLYPGIYDSESESFPEALREESRPGVVQILDAPASEPGLIEPPKSEEDPDDESNDDLDDESEDQSDEQEGNQDEKAEETEEETEKVEPKKGKTKIKRRG